jgi:hypothetical protein
MLQRKSTINTVYSGLGLPNEDEKSLLDDNCSLLKELLLSGALITKFQNTTRHTPLPKLPTTFTDHCRYKQLFDYLFQYEVYSRLLGRDDPTYSDMSKGEQDTEAIGKGGKIKLYWTASLTEKKVWGEHRPKFIHALRPLAYDKINLPLEISK